MSRRPILPHPGRFGLAVAALLCCGCSLIGALVGGVADSRKNRRSAPVQVQGWEVAKVKPGTSVTAVLANGERVYGRYDGLDATLPSAEYGPRYALGRGVLSEVVLPGLGDPVVAVLLAGRPVPGRLVGFDAGHVVVQPEGQSAPRRFRLRELASLGAADGALLPGPRLEELVADGRIPLVSRMVVGARRVPLEQVKRIEFRRAGHKGVFTGFLIGALVDAIVVAAVVDSLNDPLDIKCTTPNCVNSCPYFYSFDGQRYVLDAEPFGQALFEAAQRPDWVRMDHLRAVGGSYRMRVANELDEIEHLDEVKLLVADVAANARVVPEADGRLQVLAAPQPPVRARDLAGIDVAAAVQARDARAWTSDPIVRTGGGSAGGRDGLVLEFVRPRGASHVTLAFTVRSTPWASHLLTSLLALQGAELPAWTARMNRDAGARREFLSALRREGPLTLRLWDGGAWRERAVLANMGPAVWKEQAVRLDLNGMPDDVLRVRLDATAGMWMVDSVVADYHASESAPVAELSPAQATAGDGTDVRGLLAAADGRRFVLRRGDSADLVFAAPPARPGARRVAVLKATGYYSILVPAGGQPDRPLFDRIVRQPGAFAGYAQDLFRSQMDRAVAELDRATPASPGPSASSAGTPR